MNEKMATWVTLKKQKVVPLHIGFITLLCNYQLTLGISFDEISVSLNCCITGSWHPANKNYVFDDNDITSRLPQDYAMH